MPDFTKLGSAYTEIRADTTFLRADLAEVKNLLGQQLAMQSLAFQKMGGHAVHAGAQIKKSFKESIASALSFERVISRLAFIGTVGLVYALGRALKSAFGDGIKGARDFENALAHVNTVLDQSAKHYLPAFKKGIEEISTRLGVSVTDLAKGLYDIVSARIPPGGALEVLNAATELAVANQANLKDVVSAVITIMNSYKMSVDQASVITDKFQAAVKYGRMEMSEFAPVIGDLAAASAVLGINLDDVLGTIATMTRGGLDPKKTITSMRRAFLAMGEDAHLSAKITKEGFLSVIPVINMMERQQQKIVTGGVRGFNTFAITFQNFVEAGMDVSEMVGAFGSRYEALVTQMDTAAKRLDKAKEKWKKFWRDLADGFTDTEAVIIEGLVNLLTVTENTMGSVTDIVGHALTANTFLPMKYTIEAIINLIKNLKGEAEDLDESTVGSAMQLVLKGLEQAEKLQKEIEGLYSSEITALKDKIKLKQTEYEADVETGRNSKKNLNELLVLNNELLAILMRRADASGNYYDFVLEAQEQEITNAKLINSLKAEQGKSEAAGIPKAAGTTEQGIEGFNRINDLIEKHKEDLGELENLYSLGAIGISDLVSAYDKYIETIIRAGATDAQVSEAMMQRQKLIEQQYGRLEDAIFDMVSIATDLQMDGAKRWKGIWKSFVNNAINELNRLLAHQVFTFLLGLLFPGGSAGMGAALNLAGGGGTGGILGGGGGMPLMPTVNPVINFSPGGGGGNNQILRELVAIRTEIANKPVAHTQVLYPEQVSVVNDLGKNIRSEQGILSEY